MNIPTFGTSLMLMFLCGPAFGQGRGARGQAAAPPVAADNPQSLVRVQAARDIAGNDPFLNIPLNFFCIPGNPRANDTNAAELEPVKLFDNLYAAGNSETTVYALTTPDGIVLIDAGYADRVETVLVPGLQKLGLDPSRVRYILIAHGHADHFGGARYFQDKYGTKIAAAAEDWDAIAPTSADANQNRPKRDIVLAEGQPFQFGGITITPVATPGHTPGSLAFIFPVKDGGVTRMAGLFGSAMLTMNRVTPDGLRQYVQSLNHYIDVAKKMNVEGEVQNHGIFDGMPGRLTLLKARAAGAPNPFVVGAERYIKMWNIISECFQAEIARRSQMNSPIRTDDLRIVRVHPLLVPAILMEEIPLTDTAARTVDRGRRAFEAILDGRDRRLALVVGPCSIHDSAAALEYADRLCGLAERVSNELLVVMRVYFEKPRTTIGWKGLINDPDLDGSYHINKGLRLARRLLADLAERGMAAGTEFLDTTFGQFYADLVSWGAIGARTVESQIHRELASGLSMPVGIKNRTDGNVQVAVEAILTASSRHSFPSLTKEGTPAILETSGNPYCHLVLRGSATGPNFDAASVHAAVGLLVSAGLPPRLMIDASHGNSAKDEVRQKKVAETVAKQARSDRSIRALMVESHLVGGRQAIGKGPLVYGQSITDACLSFPDTERLTLDLADVLAG